MHAVMSTLVALLTLLSGLVALAGSFFGREFNFKPLGSQKPGKPAPAWLARPFLFVAGVFFIWGAYVLWKQQ